MVSLQLSLACYISLLTRSREEIYFELQEQTVGVGEGRDQRLRCRQDMWRCFLGLCGHRGGTFSGRGNEVY